MATQARAFKPVRVWRNWTRHTPPRPVGPSIDAAAGCCWYRREAELRPQIYTRRGDFSTPEEESHPRTRSVMHRCASARGGFGPQARRRAPRHHAMPGCRPPETPSPLALLPRSTREHRGQPSRRASAPCFRSRGPFCVRCTCPWEKGQLGAMAAGRAMQRETFPGVRSVVLGPVAALSAALCFETCVCRVPRRVVWWAALPLLSPAS